MAHFSHLWQSPLGVSETWQLIASAFENSEKSSVWPNEMAELHAQEPKLANGTRVTALYKLGRLKNPAHYRIAIFDPPRMLRYETTSEHPLKGYAVITLEPTSHGTRCRWKGEYRPKAIPSLASLAWFKLYYERRFFRKFIRNFHDQKPAAA
jgi:hypothetical protein